MKRVVIDASILLSSLTGRSDAPPAILLAAVYDGAVGAVACPFVIVEVGKNLRENPYFCERISPDDALKAVARIESAVIMHGDPSNVEQILRDPEDDYLVAVARASKAEYIVTGDKDLLEHAALEPPAINARTACELLGLIELS